jgi:hypothetical protein
MTGSAWPTFLLEGRCAAPSLQGKGVKGRRGEACWGTAGYSPGYSSGSSKKPVSTLADMAADGSDGSCTSSACEYSRYSRYPGSVQRSACNVHHAPCKMPCGSPKQHATRNTQQATSNMNAATCGIQRLRRARLYSHVQYAARDVRHCNVKDATLQRTRCDNATNSAFTRAELTAIATPAADCCGETARPRRWPPFQTARWPSNPSAGMVYPHGRDCPDGTAAARPRGHHWQRTAPPTARDGARDWPHRAGTGTGGGCTCPDPLGRPAPVPAGGRAVFGLFVCLLVCFVCLVWLFVCLFVGLLVCFVCLVCLFVALFVWLFVFCLFGTACVLLVRSRVRRRRRPTTPSVHVVRCVHCPGACCTSNHCAL